MIANPVDFKSILPFLPPLTPQPSGNLAWPNHQVTDALKLLSQGSTQSRVNSGKTLFAAIKRVRDSLPLSSKDRLANPTGEGFSEFFDEFLRKNESQKWLDQVVPVMADFVLRLPSLLETHYQICDDIVDGISTGLRLWIRKIQDEIRFMMNPELIAGMLFLPSMAINEAIEIVGAERFSNYKGYNAKFQFDGDHVDTRVIDPLQRRISRVIAIDALRRAGTQQYKSEMLLREVNKAFCGFLDHCTYQQHTDDSNVGIVTGNWGCGVFGGDPEIKSIIQWISASQASRPFVSYYTFGLEKLRNLDQVVEWIVSQKWTVGEVWKRLTDYCLRRANGEIKLGFFSYLIPSLTQGNSGSSYKRKRKNEAAGGASRAQACAKTG